MEKLSWGVISTAEIGVKKVIPPMQRSNHCRIDAIASRDLGRARAAADALGIPKAYGSYEELLADPDIQAVYNPLPNHLHVPWTIKAAEAGKHVLCEKPLGMDAEDARRLIEVRDRTGVYIQEAFMVRTHPQWHKARALVEGRIGELRAIQGFFSYFNVDPQNVRNIAEIGGGGMLDIGCYPITTSRFVTGLEPKRVIALIERDETFGTDRLGSVILDYPNGIQASFAYSTQLVPYQRMHFFGTEGRVEVVVPFNAPVDRPCQVLLDGGADLFGGGITDESVPTCDQYGVAGDAFSNAILEGLPQPVPLENSIQNMRIIDACFRSARTGQWEVP